jgi:hypothetical protein
MALLGPRKSRIAKDMRTLARDGGEIKRVEGCGPFMCCAEEGCCMYAADTATADDLPDAITLAGVGSLSKSGTSYGDTTNGVVLESGVWARYVGGDRATQVCLITGDGKYTPDDDAVEDQFEAEYTVTGEPEGWSAFSYNAVRGSLCEWQRTDGDPMGDDSLVLINYVPEEEKWQVTVIKTFASLVDYVVAGYKTGAQNTPVGDYDCDGYLSDGVTPISFTVTVAVS